MFYSQFILAKKGPLGTIWIAAHLERKLRKNQVTETNIGVSVDSILFPEVPIALRLSGHLLLGVVRIYSRKVNYLFHDCSEALVKIKQAFHSGAVDLPPEAATAPFHSITLPENFDFDDLELLPDREALFLANNSSVDHHVTSREQITLQDTVEDSTYLSTQFGLDERLDATRLEFDEDLLPPVKGVDEEEENLTLEEDTLPAVQENDDHVEDDGVKDLAPGIAEEEEQIPDLNEEQPPEAEALQEVEANNDGLDINVVPETEADIPTVPVPCEAGDQVVVASPTEAIAEEASQPEESPEAKSGEVPVQQAELPAASLEEPDPTEDAGSQEMQDKENAEKSQSPAGKTDGEAEVDSTEEQLRDVPEIEKVRSAAEVLDSEAGILDYAIPESAQKVDDASAQSSLEQDALKVQDAQETPLLKQDDAPSAMRTSPPSIDFAGPDEDLLASILGRRSLKVAPTPELPPAKRQKPGPKPGSKKRKVLLDEATVLHGDDMRHQLSDTRDIRRVRKRAPCTEYEIWNSEKEGQGQQIFDEPLVLGFRDNIREIYRCLHSVGDVKASVESETTEISSGRQKHQLDCDETEEAITLQEEVLDDYDPYDSQRLLRFDEDLEDHTLAEQRDFRACDLGIPPLKQTEDSVQDEQLQVHAKEEEETADGSNEERTNPPAVELISTAEAAPDASVPEEIESAACNTLADNVTGSEHASNNEQTEGDVKAADVNEPEIVEEGPRPEEAMDVDAVDDTSQPALEKDQDITVAVENKLIEDHSMHAQTDAGVTAIQIEEQADEHQANDQGKDQADDQDKDQADEEQADGQDKEQADEQDNVAVKELVFLTDAKDEEGDDVDNYDADYPESQVQDNTGWSVRTRAVCQYLRMTFESMEGPTRDKGGGAAKLGLERLLQGKRRRECARMFFESLVLKTKDYINVEQSAPFDNIYISARAKLMKADL